MDDTKIKVYGALTGDLTLTLPDATAKGTEPIPTASFAATGYDTGKLSNVNDGMQYSFDGVNWTDITGTEVELTGVNPGTLYVRKKGGSTTNDSSAQTIQITRAAAPTDYLADGTRCTTPDNNDGTLTITIYGLGDISTLEYRHENESTWHPVTSNLITNLRPGEYYIRNKANGTMLASENGNNGYVEAYRASYKVTFSPPDAGVFYKPDNSETFYEPDLSCTGEFYAGDEVFFTFNGTPVGRKADGGSVQPSKYHENEGLTQDGSTLYAFVMPECDVTIEALVVGPDDGMGNATLDHLIISPKENQTIQAAIGEKVTLKLEVAPDATNFQWFIDRGDGKGFVTIPGATEPSYTTSALGAGNNGYRYYCTVYNSDGAQLSPFFTLQVGNVATLPRTGDSSMPMVWLAASMLSAACILLLRKKAYQR